MPNSSGFSEEDCLLSLATAIEHYRKGPTQEEYDALNWEPSAKQISDIVGGWELALAKLGVEKQPRRRYSKENCLNAIRNLADDIGGEPTIKDYRKAGYSPSISTISSICSSWVEAKQEAGVVDYGEKSSREEAEEFFSALEQAETSEDRF